MELKEKQSVKRHFLFSFLLPAVVFALVLCFSGIYPFGDKHINLFDTWEQYYPFLFDYWRKARSGGFSLWSLTQSAEYLPLFAYYTSSPLNLLIVPLPFAALKTAFVFLIIIRVGLAGLFMSHYLYGVTKKTGFLLPVFSSLYALCGFAAAYGWHFMWLDSFALLPLVMLGLNGLMTNGRFKLYVISLALALWCNFFIGLYICIFTVIMFFYNCISLKTNFKQSLFLMLRVALYSLLAIALAAALLYPAYTASRGFAAETSNEGAFFYHVFSTIISRVTAFLPQTFSIGAPNLYSGFVCILFFIVFLTLDKISIKEKVFTIAVLVFLAVSSNLSTLDYMWSGFYETVGMPARYTFLFSFFLIGAAYKAYIRIEETDAVRCIVYASATAGLILGCCYLALVDSAVILQNFILWCVYAALFFIMATRVSFKPAVKRAAGIVMCGVILTEAGLTVYISILNAGFRENWGAYPENRVQIESLLQSRDNTEPFYRTELADWQMYNGNAAYGFNGISFYSSTANADVASFLTGLGVRGWRFGKIQDFTETSPFTGMLLNVRYLISRNGELKDNGVFWNPIAYSGDTLIYENNYYLPPGFMTNTDILSFLPVQGNPFASQNALFQKATGLTDELFELLPLNKTENGYQTVIPADGLLYVYTAAGYLTGLTCVKNKEPLFDMYMHLTPFMFLGGSVLSGDTLEFYPMFPETDGAVIIYAALINKPALDTAYAVLNANTLNVTEYTAQRIKGTITAQKEGVLYLSIPYNKNRRAYINADPAEILPIGGGMSGIVLQPGEYTIELKYTDNGFALGLSISAGAFSVFAFLVYKERRTHAKKS